MSRDGTKRRRWRGRGGAALVAAALGGAAVVVWLLVRPGPPRPDAPAPPTDTSVPSKALAAPETAPTERAAPPAAERAAGPAGEVVDPRGAPVANASVVARVPGRASGEDAATATDAAGRFALARVPAGDVLVAAYAPGYLPSEAVAWRASRQERLRLVLRQGATITGRAVRASDGAPLPAAVAEAAGPDGAATHRRGQRGDAPGRFVVGPLAPGRYAVVVRAPDLLPASLEAAVAATEAVDLGDVPLADGGFVEGEVQDAATGEALAGVRVAAESLPSPPYDEARAPWAASDAAGRFRLGPLPPGRLDLRFAKLGFDVVRRPVELGAAGAPARVETVALSPRAGFRLAEEPGPAGPGIGIRRRRTGVEVTAVVPDSPAADAGLVAGSALVEVDGYPVADLPAETVLRLVQGERDTTVSLTVRTPDGERRELTLSRH